MNLSGIVGAVDAATTSVGAAIAADLQQAATVTGMGGSFEVDLEVLYEYFGRLSGLYSEIGAQINQLRALTPPGDAQCGGAGARIPGAALAAEASAVSSGNEGFLGALTAIQALVGGHLESLQTNYEAYMKADDGNARILTAAAHPELAGNAPEAGTRPAKPKGW